MSSLARGLRAPAATRVLPAAATGNDLVGGILCIIGAALFFSACDAAAKFLTGSIPALEVVWARYAGFALVIALPLLLRGGVHALSSRKPALQILRGCCLVGSTTLFILGLRALPLADATAMSFASPLFITALSVPLLGERVGPRRWGAVILGLVGVLIVVQPGTDAFQLAAFLPLGSAICWAMGMILTRRLAGTDSTPTTLAWTALCGLVATGMMAAFVW
ncbi:MAG: DMT family transporter, partial [Acetobacteraceae bacterium]